MDELRANRQEATSNASSIRKSRNRIDDLVTWAMDGSDEAPSVKQRIDLALEQIASQADKIKEFYVALLAVEGGEGSIEAKVKKGAIEAAANQEASRSALSAMREKISDLEAFLLKVFGDPDQNPDSDAKHRGGLKAEIDDRLQQLSNAELAQKEKHAALTREIEALLPGATSAGLATAYNNMKTSFDTPIKLYTGFFYGSLGLLILAAILISVQSFSLNPFSIVLIEVKEWDSVLKALMLKAPFVAPVIWLAIFSSRRRSQYERLQQEYAHKEAFAKSYESYRKQLQALREDTEALQRELIAKAIDAISFNPSMTLDGKHEGKPPFMEAISKMGADEFLELLKNARATKQ